MLKVNKQFVNQHSAGQRPVCTKENEMQYKKKYI